MFKPGPRSGEYKLCKTFLMNIIMLLGMLEIDRCDTVGEEASL